MHNIALCHPQRWADHDGPVQMTSLTCLLLSARSSTPLAALLCDTGVFLLCVAAGLTLLSLWQYLRAVWAVQ